ncbi:hypothetical protein B0I72DRAFT_136599 [Yarrowia lipolytica]|uniref:DNA-directed RNA polymerase subunit n=2 Tax=Yarrowia lipolytica TaxID=4952 RepID=Q6C866_YARLI|nr:YALI0D22308p [Yarrowia lipolytica CLIB122]AOW04454.1 hypothetical protein YALI1_D28213g [Yarrowia lipolytica]KAB8285731.1 hypothetical protein BKA91DRAFT_132812 [Yarrowia lipolytica]KAE8172373.1 hypothetical protein BKA90DRAFT_137412 [Yarrowia lipolytica]KAJ8054072.1 hypothetical protein LXG23DRAFT_48412 [Yarrowia lipolytica]RDW26146.1 hypothetical protein B0I71DRAFT_131349 [Yarrowia lipolytica]|eukprot:XP_503146.1 YALI0D22308p [Yarrowia lipolytica CLIB122]
MLTFCPTCTNMLTLSTSGNGMRFECRTCPYEYYLQDGTIVYDRKVLEKKKVDSVLGGENAWENVDKDPGSQCPKCSNMGAYFYMLQIRSADEPMTKFCRCTACFHQWREN